MIWRHFIVVVYCEKSGFFHPSSVWNPIKNKTISIVPKWFVELILPNGYAPFEAGIENSKITS